MSQTRLTIEAGFLKASYGDLIPHLKYGNIPNIFLRVMAKTRVFREMKILWPDGVLDTPLTMGLPVCLNYVLIHFLLCQIYFINIVIKFFQEVCFSFWRLSKTRVFFSKIFQNFLNESKWKAFHYIVGRIYFLRVMVSANKNRTVLEYFRNNFDGPKTILKHKSATKTRKLPPFFRTLHIYILESILTMKSTYLYTTGLCISNVCSWENNPLT